MKIPPIPPQPNPQDGSSPLNWTYFIRDAKNYSNDPTLLKQYLDGFKFFAAAAGGNTEKFYQQLEKDLAGNKGTTTILNDINQLQGAPPNLSNADFEMASIQVLNEMKNMVSTGDTSSLTRENVFLHDFVTSSQQCPLAAQQFAGGSEYVSAFEIYLENPNSPSAQQNYSNALDQLKQLIQ